ncbi:acyl-CoA carboxylase subunit epsilon [Amnibacterium setariae]|uniref:Acyl-CoA carboxylase subunit epsilon n=1 Tax=Amnibacterium setariae TaxID=2306585 RepID=A0A3A1TXZ5_9MICO|nr:acyl-CoA carboxylase subunit epsilon [Amnibacterium setariae]RIX26569.1 acyl-CoA carboxylase subunit epsilon [Amnibacterium setariae]
MTDAEPLPIRIVSGSPTDEETAAITALVSGLLLERAVSATPLPNEPVRSNWERTSRSLRGPWPVEKDWRDR